MEQPETLNAGSLDKPNRRVVTGVTEKHDELVEQCHNMRTALETISTYYRGNERSAESVLEMRRIAKRALVMPNSVIGHKLNESKDANK